MMIWMAAHSFAFALFHLFFWSQLGWKTELKKISGTNSAVMQILNLRIIYVFLGFGLIPLLFPEELQESGLGTAFLVFVSGFWIGRTIEQFVYRRLMNIYSKIDLVLLGMFIIGAVFPLLVVFR